MFADRSYVKAWPKAGFTGSSVEGSIEGSGMIILKANWKHLVSTEMPGLWPSLLQFRTGPRPSLHLESSLFKLTSLMRPPWTPAPEESGAPFPTPGPLRGLNHQLKWSLSASPAGHRAPPRTGTALPCGLHVLPTEETPVRQGLLLQVR